MSKDSKKNDSVTIRLPEELRQYEAYGFKNITEFIKTSIQDFMSKQAFEVSQANEILKSISFLIEAMEADRDYNYSDGSFPAEKEQLLAALYEAAKPIANAEMMVKHPANWVDYPEEMKEEGVETDEKHYAHTWAR